MAVEKVFQTEQVITIFFVGMSFGSICAIGIYLGLKWKRLEKRFIMLVSTVAKVVELIQEEEETQYCKRCNTFWLKNALFCYHCGEKQDPYLMQKVCKSCMTPMPQKAFYCPHCRRRMWLRGSTLVIPESNQNISYVNTMELLPVKV